MAAAMKNSSPVGQKHESISPTPKATTQEAQRQHLLPLMWFTALSFHAPYYTEPPGFVKASRKIFPPGKEEPAVFEGKTENPSNVENTLLENLSEFPKIFLFQKRQVGGFGILQRLFLQKGENAIIMK